MPRKQNLLLSTTKPRNVRKMVTDILTSAAKARYSCFCESVMIEGCVRLRRDVRQNRMVYLLAAKCCRILGSRRRRHHRRSVQSVLLVPLMRNRSLLQGVECWGSALRSSKVGMDYCVSLWNWIVRILCEEV
jgi:hypothetical protein